MTSRDISPAAPAEAAPEPARDVAARVLRLEGRAVLQLADTIASDDAFDHAVDAILGARGRVIVSGMGKSGHVARKIAATLASTGTPAHFVHPAEAAHGDLGMVTNRDVALVLSNSGETPEIMALVAHTRRFDIPLIGVAKRRDSTLLRSADVALELPDAPEACAIGLAPTTSTTATMALGDALAVAAMTRRAFTPEQFRLFHPGGALGAQLLSVRALMHGADELPLIAPDAPMADAILEMSRRSFGVVGVVDADGRLVGAITDGDLRRKMDGLLDRTAGEVSTAGPKTIAADALAADALGRMNRMKITCLFVTETGSDAPERPVGLLHVHDCLRAGVA